MSRPAWMPLYVADYLADTRRLDTLQHGAYLLLIMEYWRAGSLPDDDAALATICGLSERKWKAIRPTIERLFEPGWKHKRIEKEMEKAREKSQARSEAGARGGAAKALKSQEPDLAIATGLPQQNASKTLASSSHPPSQKEDGSNIYIIHQGSSAPPREREPAKAAKAATPFPSDRSICYTPFGPISRAEAPGTDPDVIAAAFRSWARKERIPFDREDIERVFRTFAKQHRTGRLA